MGTYKYYWEKVNLSFRLGLCFFKINQDREIWPPELPVYERGVPATKIASKFTTFKFRLLVIEYKHLLPTILPTYKRVFPGFLEIRTYFHLLQPNNGKEDVYKVN